MDQHHHYEHPRASAAIEAPAEHRHAPDAHAAPGPLSAGHAAALHRPAIITVPKNSRLGHGSPSFAVETNSIGAVRKLSPPLNISYISCA